MTEVASSRVSIVPLTLVAGIDDLSRAVVERLRAEITSYEAVPYHEHRELVRSQISDILMGVAMGSPPSPEQLKAAHALGWRRAAQGVPMQDVMEAYHVCYREMWTALVQLARESGEGSDKLVEMVHVLWSWTHGLSGAVANGHADAVRTRFAEASESRRLLFEALASNDTDLRAARRLAASLGFDPAGQFQAFAAPYREQWSPDEIETPLRRLARNGVAHYRCQGGVLIVLGQRLDAQALATLLQGVDNSAPVGVGIARLGLAGAAASMKDASRAMELAEHSGGIVIFEESWLLCALFSERAVLEEPLEAGAEVAREHPHLAETVMAFATHSFRVAECARSLDLHPNGARYRLERWAELTGWDPLTFDGLLRSVASIRLFR